jgi:hypothetical protein
MVALSKGDATMFTDDGNNNIIISHAMAGHIRVRDTSADILRCKKDASLNECSDTGGIPR